MPIRDYKTIREYAEHMLTLWGCDGWKFGYNHDKNRLGVCRYRNKVIEIAHRFAETASLDDVQDTILHEIAHILAGKEKDWGHGRIWRYWADRLGARPEACAQVDHAGELAVGKYSAVCGCCRATLYKHRKPATNRRYNCRKCGPAGGSLEFKPA